jgi:hypothetical protein
MPLNFLTLSVDLVEHAERFALFLGDMGFRVKAETQNIAYPASPTLFGKKGPVEFFVEVVADCDIKQVESWVSYMKCRQTESYFALVLPMSCDVNSAKLVHLRGMGVGLYYSDENGVREILAPSDLTLNIALPPLTGKPKALQRDLKPIFQKFQNGNWADGFKDACQLLEDKARRKLVVHIRNGQKTFSKQSGTPRTITIQQVNKFTLGQLAIAYSEIVLPTAEDIAIASALKAVNEDRIGAVHKGNNARVKARLKRNVGLNLWVVLNGLGPFY